METAKRNLTRDEKLSLQQDQLLAQKGNQIAAINGDTDAIPTKTANRNPKYTVRVLDDGYVHVKTLVKHLDASQKNFVNEEHIVKIHAREFDRRVKEGAFKTYDDVEVIHDPRANAPETYNLKGDFAEVTAGQPADANVKLATSKPQPAGKPGEGRTATQIKADEKAAKDKAAADKKAADEKIAADKRAADEEALRLQNESNESTLPNLGDVDPNAPTV